MCAKFIKAAQFRSDYSYNCRCCHNYYYCCSCCCCCR